VGFLKGKHLSLIPNDTRPMAGQSLGRTQWLLVLPSVELNVRFRLEV
jgi:hypothetical protein